MGFLSTYLPCRIGGDELSIFLGPRAQFKGSEPARWDVVAMRLKSIRDRINIQIKWPFLKGSNHFAELSPINSQQRPKAKHAIAFSMAVP